MQGVAEQNTQAPQAEGGQDLKEILQIRRNKLFAMQEQGRDPYQNVTFDAGQKAREIAENFEELEGKKVSVAGRIMSRRGMGKASFMDLRDVSGQVQIYAKIDVMGEEPYKTFMASLDIGDIVGVEGEAFRTKRGEISVKAAPIPNITRPIMRLRGNIHGGQHYHPFQGAAAFAGEVSWPAGYRRQIPPAVFGSHYEP